MGDDHSDVIPNKLGRKLSGEIASSLSVADIKRDITPFRVAEILQSMPQRIGKRVGLRCGDQSTYAGYLSNLLRKGPTQRCQRPRSHSTAQCYELASFHCSAQRANCSQPSKHENTPMETGARCGNVRRTNPERPRSE